MNKDKQKAGRLGGLARGKNSSISGGTNEIENLFRELSSSENKGIIELLSIMNISYKTYYTFVKVGRISKNIRNKILSSGLELTEDQISLIFNNS